MSETEVLSSLKFWTNKQRIWQSPWIIIMLQIRNKKRLVFTKNKLISNDHKWWKPHGHSTK